MASWKVTATHYTDWYLSPVKYISCFFVYSIHSFIRYLMLSVEFLSLLYIVIFLRQSSVMEHIYHSYLPSFFIQYETLFYLIEKKTMWPLG